jgi:peptide/nickel transport system ATP-binding protein
VLYAGRLIERGAKNAVLGAPAHPYTKGLLASLPKLSDAGRMRRIAPIPGRFPDLTDPPDGCVFADRCPFVEARCREPQALAAIDDGRLVRCWKSDDLPGWPEAAAVARRPGRSRSGTLLRTDRLTKVFRRGKIGGGIEWKRKFGVFPWPETRTEAVNAVDGISLEVGRGEVVGLVGESGSGKSTFGRTVLRLTNPTSGSITLDGDEIADKPEQELGSLRKRAQIVFQNPDSSLNSRRRVGDAIARAVSLHTNVPAHRRREHCEDLLDRVGLPRGYYDRYPHQLSGGEKQRVGIARAIATEPEFIVCDEPVSALDVSVQATVLNLLDDLRDELGLSYLFISHDLSVVAYIADRIAVMYSGRICEVGPTEAVLQPPYHPYTEALLSAVPLPTPGEELGERVKLRGDRPPSASERSGCPFHTRCPRSLGALCETTPPPVIEPTPGHRIACHLDIGELNSLPPLQIPRTRKAS